LDYILALSSLAGPAQGMAKATSVARRAPPAGVESHSPLAAVANGAKVWMRPVAHDGTTLRRCRDCVRPQRAATPAQFRKHCAERAPSANDRVGTGDRRGNREKRLQLPFRGRRDASGRKAARGRGIHFGCPRKLHSEQRKLARQLIDEGQSVREIADTFNVHTATIYRLSATAA
jgi:hypothetical protein